MKTNRPARPASNDGMDQLPLRFDRGQSVREDVVDMSIRQTPPVLMNEQEVALFIGICTRSVRNFTARGMLPVIRLGRRRLYRRDTVMAALQRMERST